MTFSASAFGLKNPLIDNAYFFAHAAHFAIKHKRKYTGDDYIVHPVRVALKPVQTFYDKYPEMIAAALLHDVVEDTGVSMEQLSTLFPESVVD